MITLPLTLNDDGKAGVVWFHGPTPEAETIIEAALLTEYPLPDDCAWRCITSDTSSQATANRTWLCIRRKDNFNTVGPGQDAVWGCGERLHSDPSKPVTFWCRHSGGNEYNEIANIPDINSLYATMYHAFVFLYDPNYDKE
jgi:hypothetical protein